MSFINPNIITPDEKTLRNELKAFIERIKETKRTQALDKKTEKPKTV
jgi:hypothetical protein